MVVLFDKVRKGVHIFIYILNKHLEKKSKTENNNE